MSDPFAPLSSPRADAGGAPCPACGQPMDPATASYDAYGRLFCRGCVSASQSATASAVMHDGDPTTVRNLYGMAGASAFLGSMTCCVSALGTWFFVAALLPISGGASVLYNLRSNPDARARLGGGVWVVALLAASGVAFGVLGTLLGVAGLLGLLG